VATSALTLIDTDVLIDFSRGVPAALHAIAALSKDGRGAVNTIAVLEFQQGARNKDEWLAFAAILRSFVHVPLDTATANKAVALFETYRLSHGLGLADCLIAASALTRQIQLLTGNRRDYRFIEGLSLLPYPSA